MNCQVNLIADYFNGTMIVSLGSYDGRSLCCSKGSESGPIKACCSSGSYTPVVNENTCVPRCTPKKRVRTICTDCC